MEITDFSKEIQNRNVLRTSNNKKYLYKIKTAVYDEPELVRMLKERSEEGFAYLYQNYSANLLFVIMELTSDNDMALDLLQEVFIKIYCNIDFFDTNYRLYTWMVTIAKNLSKDKLQSKTVRNYQKNIEISLITDSRFFQTTINVDHIGLKRLCMKLKPKYWEVIELNYFKGHPHDEIANMLQMPIGTVKTRIRSALHQLRKLVSL
jgi:RNA polymerase sigma factor (sigma-70 family)